MKIYTALPKPFLARKYPDDHFFSRDMGLTCLTLRELGYESMVVMPDGPDAKKHPDVIRTTLAAMETPEFWRKLGVHAVILWSWAAPRYTPVARAIKTSGAKLLLRCDNGGPYSQREKGVRRSFREHYLGQRYVERGAVIAGVAAAMKTPLFYIPAVFDNRVLEHMSFADVIYNETPDGALGLKHFLVRAGRGDIAARVQYLPHPIAPFSVIDPDAGGEIRKERRVFAVGRWDSHQKNARMCVRVLSEFLKANPDYEADLIGPGDWVVESFRKNMPESVQRRITVYGRMNNAEVRKHCARARIFFATSRSESFNIAAAEALSEGCTLVGGSHIASFRHFVSRNSGTLARRYTAKDLLAALWVEVEAWEQGARDPRQIVREWRMELAARAVTGRMVKSIDLGAHA
jgi:glycosyltransferase involved in cell wall biosynthesis